MASLLDNDKMISEYLTQVLEDGDSDELICALGYIAKAKGMAIVAKESELGRESLFDIPSSLQAGEDVNILNAAIVAHLKWRKTLQPYF